MRVSHGECRGVGVEDVEAEFLQSLFKDHVHHGVLLAVLRVQVADLQDSDSTELLASLPAHHLRFSSLFPAYLLHEEVVHAPVVVGAGDDLQCVALPLGGLQGHAADLDAAPPLHLGRRFLVFLQVPEAPLQRQVWAAGGRQVLLTCCEDGEEAEREKFTAQITLKASKLRKPCMCGATNRLPAGAQCLRTLRPENLHRRSTSLWTSSYRCTWSSPRNASCRGPCCREHIRYRLTA